MHLLQILPRVPPAVCGVGDYAWRLARVLADDHDIHSSFLSAGTSWVQPSQPTPFPVSRLPALTSSAFQKEFQSHPSPPDAILLHLSPYGYQKRALPWWLASGWSHLSRSPKRPALITMFHELFASGPVTSSAFWLQPLQKRILRRLAAASDARRTNREDYARWLDTHPGASPCLVMPVFSNFGECHTPTPLKDRDPAMVMFAWANHSPLSLQQLIKNAAALAKNWGLTHLHVIGNSASAPASPSSVHLVRHGFLEEDAAARLLASCRVAYTAYSPDHFGKSTLMAAFAAHGLAVITRGLQPNLPDGLNEGREVLHEAGLIERPPPNLDQLQTLASNLHLWYQSHSLARTGESFATQIHQTVHAIRS